MRRIILYIAVLLIPCLAAAQDSPRQDEALRRIVAASAAIESFSCDFEQVREVAILSEPDVSRGVMQYNRDGRILWRYTSPSAYQIAFTKDAVVITRNGQVQNLGFSDSPYLGQLRELLLGIMNGGELARDGQFQVRVMQYEPETVVSLIPEKRQLKRLFSEIVMSFSAKTGLVSGVHLKEADGSSTRITFSNQKTN